MINPFLVLAMGVYIAGYFFIIGYMSAGANHNIKVRHILAALVWPLWIWLILFLIICFWFISLGGKLYDARITK